MTRRLVSQVPGLYGLLVVGSFTTVDFFILLATLPGIRGTLGATTAEVQLLLAAFWIVNAALLVVGGKLGDRLGSLRLLKFGMAWTAMSALLASMATSVWWLVGMRASMGAGVAMSVPQVLAMLRRTEDLAARQRAFEVYGLALGVAAVLAQLAGATLMIVGGQDLGWRLGSLMSAISCATALWLLRSIGDRRIAPSPHAAITLASSSALVFGLGAVCSALTLGRQAGWPTWAWASLVSGALLCAAVLSGWPDTRDDAMALIPRRMRADKRFVAGVLGVSCFYLGVSSYYLFLSTELSRGNSGQVATSMVFMLMAAAIAVGSGSRKISVLVGAKWLGTGVAVLVLSQMLLIAAPDLLSGPWRVAWTSAAAGIQGLGLGLLMGRLTGEAVGRAGPEDSALAGGLSGTAQQIGNALGVCFLGVVYLELDNGATYASWYLVATYVLSGAAIALSRRSSRERDGSLGNSVRS